MSVEWYLKMCRLSTSKKSWAFVMIGGYFAIGINVLMHINYHLKLIKVNTNYIIQSYS